MRRLVVAALSAAALYALLGYSFGLGYLAGSHGRDVGAVWAKRALNLAMMFRSRCDEGDRTACGFRDVAGRREVPCAPFAGDSDPRRRPVLLTLGQSNSANSGETKHVAREGVLNLNLHDGRCYHAEDPLLGPGGDGGSVWTRLGDQLIESGAEQVLIVGIGIGGSEIARWAPGGDLHVRVEHAARVLEEMNIRPTHVLWHQGETDARLETGGSEYERMFGELLEAIRDYGVDAPVYPAAASICRGITNDEIRSAQLSLPVRLEGVYPGADTDRLDEPDQRFDRCHFSDKGLSDHAALWVGALRPTVTQPRSGS